MPDLLRTPNKLIVKGVDLYNPVDMIPAGYMPIVRNVRALQNGRIDGRPGMSRVYQTTSTPAHTIRRLNNQLPGASPSWTLLSGTGTVLDSGQTSASQIATGFSGDPLSMVPFRPEQSPEAYMYIGDSAKMVKVNTGSTVKNIGIAPPAVEPSPDISSIFTLTVMEGDSATGWTPDGTVVTSPPSVVDRAAAGTTVNVILYDSGTTGFCTISPTNASGEYDWLQKGASVRLNASENVVVLEVLPNVGFPGGSTTIAGIIYDSGTTGLCSIALANQSVNLSRNSLLTLGGSSETVRVLSVTIGPTGLYSLRCSTANTHSAGDSVTSLLAFRCATVGTIAATQTITAKALEFTLTKAGTGYIAGNISANGSSILGRPVTPEDYVHISIKLDNPANLTVGRVSFDLDPNNTTAPFNGNYLYKEFRPNDLQSNANSTLAATVSQQTAIQNQLVSDQAPDSSGNSIQIAPGQNQWCEIIFPISDFVQVGTNANLSLATISTLMIELTCTAALVVDVAAWYIEGTFGPNVLPGSPTGLQYQYRYRDSRTGAKSMLSPVNRYQLFPLRQGIAVGVTASTDPQVDTIDIQRFDPNLGRWVFVGSTANTTGTFSDEKDVSVISNNPPLETDVFQPFLVTDSPKSGTATVAGTTVIITGGDALNTNLTPGTVITINGIVTQTYTTPASTSKIQITQNLGALSGVTYKIDEPGLFGQPLPILFGPLEGPTAAFMFGLGDSRNPGFLYWLNGNDPDSQGQENFIEITPPSEPLIAGCVWGTTVFVASETRVFKVTPSFTQSGNLFIATQIGTISGCHGSWAMCPGKDAVFMLGRDGIYKISLNSVDYYSQALWPLFPHDGKDPTGPTNGYQPVDMTNEPYLRLSYADSSLYFHYKDTNGDIQNWKADADGGWWHEDYSPVTLMHYFEELPDNSSNPRMLMGTSDGYIYSAGGTQDNGVDVICTIRTPSFDNGDPRTLKLYMDAMTEINGTAQMTIGFNRFETTQAPVTVGSSTGDREFVYSNLTSLTSIPIYSDIAAQYTFNPGTLLYEFSPSLYPQPFYGRIYTTQLKDHGIAGWKQLRYRRIALLSTAEATLTIVNDDGATLVSQALAATGGGLQNLYDNLPNASKGKMLRYSVTSLTPFVLFPEDTYVRMKKWGGNQFLEVRPFIDGQLQTRGDSQE